MSIAPITKSASIYNEIKRKILEGEFPPGSHLVIKQIATEYGLSDIPVREALKELRAEGLVETIPHVGSRVASFSPQNIKDMLEMRECLETFAAELAVQNADDSLIQKLEEKYAEASQALADNDIQRYGELNKAFHRLIIEASGNQLLIQTISDLMESEKRMRMVFQIFPEILQDSHKEHQQMLQYVKERNPAAMERLMYHHKKRSFDKMRVYFQIQ
ncbi:GntR family transcriptional regulator [Acetonema longum]|uniref:Transcriptional regulator, GntR family protein n=1 Tax=Acetonema longum DSM 6540 TaxID=1009370 RepID=F7NE25_9FIRM|nr:GntR family transcriptional regulator [Acetonema longum]EGO65680.1 transcriptional regulator, GntR family protein [Acetonema longum DSM 6540]